MRIAMTHTRLRVEERLLLDAFERNNIEIEPVDLRGVVFDLANRGWWSRFDVILDRSISLTNALNAARILEGYGIRHVNRVRTIATCSDKLATSIELARRGIPTPQVMVATCAESALDAVESVGYPAVIKPTVGSWGRLVARVNDRDAAEAIIEHRATLGSPSVFYVQEHVDKPKRDLRVFVVGDEPIAAIARTSEHWVTNTARGASAAGFQMNAELADLACRASMCVEGDIVAVDVFECPRRGLLVNELNHSMEFRNSIDVTGVDIPQRIVEHVMLLASSADRRAQSEAVQ